MVLGGVNLIEMTEAEYKAIDWERDFPMTVRKRTIFDGIIEYVAEDYEDLNGWFHIEIVRKNPKLKIFGKMVSV